MEYATAILGLLLLSGIRPVFVVDPSYPPNVLAGGSVIASVSIDKGSVGEVRILSGEEPFAGSVAAALKGWRFSRDIANARVLVVIHFRNPNLMTASPAVQKVGPPGQSSRDRTLPYPTKVVDPVYPANALGQGATTVRLEIDKSGKVTLVDAPKSVGALTRSFANAVREWQFLPAEDGKGHPVPSEALAVCVYRFPVLTVPAPPERSRRLGR